MKSICFPTARVLGLITAVLCSLGFAAAEPQHGIAMYGDPALPPDFVSLPYVNPDAPKGGRIVLAERGSFDSLNPFIFKGRAPWQLRFLVSESLMGRNWDEPFSLYGVLAESIQVGPDREWAEFTLREGAQFSDGTPVTIEDVMWSYETLSTQGHPRYLGLWSKVESMEQTGPRSVRFSFNSFDPELAMLIGMRPILKKAQWDGVDFTQSTLDNIPITTGPYVITDFRAGRYVELTKNPDYWGADLPFTQGLYNLETIRIEFFGDSNAILEALKAGIITSHRESNPQAWAVQYDFPRVQSGEVVKSEIPHQRPSGMTGYVMNTRHSLFSDWRVRDALIHAFNFEFINQSITGGLQPRITSYFSNSELGMRDGPAEGRVRDLLEPFADILLPGMLDGYSPPVSDGTLRNRQNLRHAVAQLEAAGWTVQDGILRNAEGRAFEFEILLKQGDTENTAIMNIYVQALERLGIKATIVTVDDAQYTDRTNNYDFDMTNYQVGLSLSPGNEQYAYWGGQGVNQPGTRNWMGVNDPVAEAMIDHMLAAETRDDLITATRALDRVLTAGRYVIPNYQWNVSRIAHARQLKYPEYIPIYGDWFDWQPHVWWYEE
ncbi:extracellular solute-binding protein [Pseudaestuariivita rosea]|uniref:extracellular solute-binding protein n=1 Tax=Pseudaestuariivita rosea TaxID=2763263 RepID=UPI001ABB24F4|nr:extracellular solute-binding protein [Pseudaestuariivita rosea]